jgi:carbon storage regulator
MLVLSRKMEESIFIGPDIEVTVLSVANGRVKLGIRAPQDVRVLRGELHDDSESTQPDLLPRRKVSPLSLAVKRSEKSNRSSKSDCSKINPLHGVHRVAVACCK